MQMINDVEAYTKYTHLRHWYNKLWLSEELGYNCGPASIAPKESGWYVVRPMMNLSGMGAEAKKVWIDSGDTTKTPLGHFWCEWFEGKQYSITYEWRGFWHPVSSLEGIKAHYNLSKFSRWEKSDKMVEIGNFFDELSDVGMINVEFIEDNVIEVHLRKSPDPDYDILIPVWKGEEYMIDKCDELGYIYIDSYDDADGFLDLPRIGFMVKNF